VVFLGCRRGVAKFHVGEEKLRDGRNGDVNGGLTLASVRDLFRIEHLGQINIMPDFPKSWPKNAQYAVVVVM
jgi:hypothetical protein